MAKTAQSGPQNLSIMSAPWQKWPNLFSCQAHLRKKHYQVYFITMQSEQTNIKIYRRKYINNTSRIHTFVLEGMQIRKPCQIKIAF